MIKRAIRIILKKISVLTIATCGGFLLEYCMNKKALLAVCIAVLIPLAGYVILKTAGEKAIVMPKHYLPDSVINSVSEGKITTDTIWHKVADIKLVNQLGETVNFHDVKGKVIVADFFF